MFTQRKPRGFQHKWIYVDERKEKLQKLEEKAKQELGMCSSSKEFEPERIRGSFVESTKHLKRYKKGHSLGYGALIVAILVMLFILNYLVTGSWYF